MRAYHEPQENAGVYNIVLESGVCANLFISLNAKMYFLIQKYAAIRNQFLDSDKWWGFGEKRRLSIF